MSSKFFKGGKYVFNMLVPKPKIKIKGEKSKESIIKKGKEFKSKLADEAKKAQEAEWKKRPWKDPKKKWDQALREYVKK